MPVFDSIAKEAAEGCLIKPILLDFFQRDQQLQVTLHIDRTMDRPYDGWFHSSTHPLQDEHALWMYLAHPKLVKREAMGYIGAMSTMFGTITGEVLKAALSSAGIAIKVPSGTCPACGLPQPAKCREHGACQPETRSRGHLDDIADFGGEGTYGIDWKTIKPYGLKGVPDMDAEAFRLKWPKYYAQGQDYMRMTGLRRFIFMFVGLGNPWMMREFHIEFDPVFAYQIECKYKRVIDAWQNDDVL